jgi:ribosomal-protein-alanine N-acetyltransferase
MYQAQILEIERLSFPSPWNAGAFEAELNKPVSNLWVIISNKCLWGYICFWMLIDEIQLVNIAVHPFKRGQGYGQALLNKMLELGNVHGIEYVWLEVRPSNRAAKNLYSKLGFCEIGSRPRYYMDTHEDAIIMALEPKRKSENGVC